MRKCLRFAFAFQQLSGLARGKSTCHQDEIFLGILFKLRLAKNLRLQASAPDAPVRTGKIEEEQLIARLGLGLGLCEISQPVRFRLGGAENDSAKRGREEADDGSFSRQNQSPRGLLGRKAQCVPVRSSFRTGKRPRTGSLTAGDNSCLGFQPSG